MTPEPRGLHLNAPPIAVQLYTLREECAKDFAGVLRRVAEIGYVGVELAGLNGLSAEEVGHLLDDNGLRLASAHLGLDPAEDFEPALDMYKALGTDTVVVPVLFPDDFASADAIKQSAARLNSAAEKAKQRSLTLGYHNHFWELEQQVNDKPALVALFEELEPRIIAEVDIYWAQTGGVDPAELVTELGERVELLHVKDGPAEQGQPMTAVGEGEVDVAGVLAAAPKARWHLVELDECATSMIEAVERSYNYLVSNGLSQGNR